MRYHFQKFAKQVSDAAGSPYAFLSSAVIVLIWLAAGQNLKYSDGWLSVMGTGTGVITFLMVFVIQAAQNRESKIAAINQQNILRALPEVPNTLLALDEDAEDRLDKLQDELKEERQKAEES